MLPLRMVPTPPSEGVPTPPAAPSQLIRCTQASALYEVPEGRTGVMLRSLTIEWWRRAASVQTCGATAQM